MKWPSSLPRQMRVEGQPLSLYDVPDNYDPGAGMTAAQKATYDAKMKAARDACAPGASLPSYFFWDANSALSDYLATGEMAEICDFPIPDDDKASNGTLTAHYILFQAPQAFRVTYPFGQQWHLSIRPQGKLTATDSITKPSMQDRTGPIASSLHAVGLGSSDVPLAMFAGLVREDTNASVDMWSGVMDTLYQEVKQALSDAASQNYAGLYSDVAGDISAQGSTPWMAQDQARYKVTVNSRTFSPAVSGPAWSQAFQAVKAAHQNGTSIADALQNVANAGVESKYFSMQANLHRENEARAHAAVNDPGFAGYAASKGMVPDVARRTWLKDAGAAVPSVFAGLPLSHRAFASTSSSSSSHGVFAVVGALLIGAGLLWRSS